MIEWKDMIGYEGVYRISNRGNVFSIKNGYNLRLSDSHGYRSARLTNNGVRKIGSVHRIVAKHFISNTECFPEVNHINGNKSDNRVENLEWCSRKRNVEHANALGLCNYRKKMDDFKVLALHTMYNSGFTLTEISKYYKISVGTASAIASGKHWKHLKF